MTKKHLDRRATVVWLVTAVLVSIFTAGNNGWKVNVALFVATAGGYTVRGLRERSKRLSSTLTATVNFEPGDHYHAEVNYNGSTVTFDSPEKFKEWKENGGFDAMKES